MELSGFMIQEDTSVLDAMAAIDASGRQIVFVCEGAKLRAAVSDGDIRRYILGAGDMSKPVKNMANYNPLALAQDDAAKAAELMERHSVKAIPVVDKDGCIVSIAFADRTNARKRSSLGVPVVIMAGGRGERLAPYTNVLPKPLIPVGELTITERIMRKFEDFGCDDFTMIVNHKRELIKAYFKETPLNVALRFVDEEAFQGTGGGLKLVEDLFGGTFFMTNCDVLIDADYEDILKRHRENASMITMVCAVKKLTVPYGIVEIDKQGKPSGIAEKPEFPFLINAGLYVIEPEFLKTIPDGAFVHITELIQRLIDEGKPVGVYPISDTGMMDMGQEEGLMAMRQNYIES